MGRRRTEQARRRAIALLTRALCPLGEERHRKAAIEDLSKVLWSLHPPKVEREYTDRLARTFVDELQHWLRASALTRDVAAELAEALVDSLTDHVLEAVDALLQARLEQRRTPKRGGK